MNKGKSSFTAKGEEKAWEILLSLEPEEVCKNALVEFDNESKLYKIKSFGIDFFISADQRKIFSYSDKTDLFIKRLGDFFRLSVICYLTNAKNIPLTGRLIKIESMKDGEIFSRGSHILPISRLADRYSSETEAFLNKGKEFGGEILNYSDVSLKFLAFPRIPTVMILWKADEEFPARGDLLFDSTCEFHLPVDVTWSIAMINVLMMF